MIANKTINYIHFDTVDSTNTWAKTNAPILDPNQVTCITALEQTAGRGRGLRKWISPKGQNIYATLFFCVPSPCTFIGNLGQILSVSCVTVLKKLGFSLQIKWPNDLLLSEKKVAGILCETVSLQDRIGIVLGIGLNVNMSEGMLKLVDQPATSLSAFSGHTWSLEQILDPIVQQFIRDLSILEKQGFAAFHSLYEQHLIHKETSISASDGINTWEGVCKGVNSEGMLLLELPSGELVTLSAAQVRLHPSYAST
jgi:BirA family biotin operon repressor/biotin-[acetyl-CoA-carboxylase] ligase